MCYFVTVTCDVTLNINLKFLKWKINQKKMEMRKKLKIKFIIFNPDKWVIIFLDNYSYFNIAFLYIKFKAIKAIKSIF